MRRVTEIRVTYKPSVKDNPVIKSSADALHVLKEFYKPETMSLQESFVVLYLNQQNKVLGGKIHSTGGITGTVADSRLVFGTALKAAATAIILSHNHPSGALVPSKRDISLTEQMKKAGDLLDIKVLDHIIIGHQDEFISLADQGYL
jgi:DNA repair protein RadC